MTDNTITLKFESIKLPVFANTKGDTWVRHDHDDNWPAKLIGYLNESAKHNAIVLSKVNYIYGKGFGGDDNLLSIKNLHGETINDIAKKCITDVAGFGGFYLQVIPTKGGGIMLYHVPFNKMRVSYDLKKFYYKEDGDFQKNKTDIKTYPAYVEGLTSSSILYYREYRIGLGTYPLPDYIGAINYIAADCLVAKHTQNNAQSGFTPSKVVSIIGPEPDKEGKRQIENKFKKKYSGEDGWKIILEFINDPTKKTQIEDLGQSDLTKEDFTAVDSLIEKNIFAGHQIVSPILFGIKTEGQLGGSTELKASYKVFKNTYTNAKQQEIERIFNRLAKKMGAVNEIKLLPTDPIGFELDPVDFKDKLPASWIMEHLGIDVNSYPDAPAQVQDINTPSAAAVNSTLNTLTGRGHQQLGRILRDYTKGKLNRQQAAHLLKVGYGFDDAGVDEFLGDKAQFSAEDEDGVINVFSQFGVSKKDYFTLKTKPLRFSADDEEITLLYQSFELTTVDAQVLQLIQKDPKITPEIIAQQLSIDVSAVNEIISRYTADGIINESIVKRGADTETKRTLSKPLSEIKPTEIKLPQIKVLYSYEWKPEVPANQRDTAAHPSRPFCHKLMDLDKYYTRTDIENLSKRLGYSVWERKGGFWNKGDEVSAECRHNWQLNVVVKK